MAKTTIRITDGALEWVRPDGSVEFAFHVEHIAPALVPMVIAYGAKQILADGGAVGRNVPDAERIGKMEKRARALRDGTWAFRDGHGVPAADALIDLQFAALVAEGILSNDMVEAWRDLKPSERAAVMRDNPAAQARVDAARPTNAALAEAAMAKLMKRIGQE